MTNTGLKAADVKARCILACHLSSIALLHILLPCAIPFTSEGVPPDVTDAQAEALLAAAAVPFW